MKKLILAGTLCLTIGLLFIAWKDKEGNKKVYSQKQINSAFVVNSLDANAMIQHFQENFNVTTKKVVFTVHDLKSIVANLEDNAKVEFVFAAYKEEDLNRYKLKSPKYYNMVKDKATLLIRTSSDITSGTMIFDTGEIQPPPYD